MLDWTDRHCRYLLRLFTRRALLYTEMVTTGALLNSDRDRYLLFDRAEHPVALQLGGSDPAELGECAHIGEDYGFDEINLNIGCPSDRVQSGRFGACLMAEPALVADCVAAMQHRVAVPVTVKTRIGIDDQDDIGQLLMFVRTVADAGCRTFIIHARNAWLKGLSPKENRSIPPLNYDYVYEIKKMFPELTIVVNGGINDLDAAESHLECVDGVMLGRAAYHDPQLLAKVDSRFFNNKVREPAAEEIVEQMIIYTERELKAGTSLKHITRHMLTLFHGQPGARKWRRHLSQLAPQAGSGVAVIREALSFVNQQKDLEKAVTGYDHGYG